VTTKNDDVYVFPTTYPQKQIWFLNQLDQESPAYNIPFAYDIEGELNVIALHNALNEIVCRHETFRTIFVDSEDGLVQAVFPEMKLDMPIIDYSTSTDADIDGQIKSFIDEESIKIFDLTKGPLIRVSVIKRSENSFILFLNFHHIILDHISIVQFAEELSVIYKSFLADENSPLQQPELQYADYAVWQNEHQSHEILLSKLDYWTEQLAGKSEYLDLPLDYQRPSRQTMVGKEYHLWFPVSLLNNLKAISRQESVSMYITLMAGYSILLGKYSKQNDVSVGTPFANRSHQPELEKVMGCFINTVPICTDLSGNPSFKEVLKRVRKSVFGANAHQELPFEMIVEALQPKRDASYNPMFQVAFTFQEPPMEIELEACKVKSQRLHNQSAKFDILAWLWEAKDGIRGTLEYNTDILDGATLERFSHHLQTLLENAVNNPDAPISDLTIMSDSEYNKVIKDWNQTSKSFDAPSYIHKLFEQSCESNPDKVAAICDGEETTYRELNERANMLANFLISQGVSNNALVGVCLERSVNMLVATLGILKAGACYIPLDPEYPQDRIHYMLENSAAKIVVVDAKTSKHIEFPVTTQQVLVNDPDISLQPTDNPSVEMNTDDLAYIIYTSGSTGKPKGVMVPHNAAANFLLSMAEMPGLTSEDTLLAVTTLSFDIAVLELYLPLSRGAIVVIATSDETLDGEDLIDLMEDNDVSVMQATPSTWRLLIASKWDGNPSLKVLCGGEAMPKDLLIQLLPKVGQVWNMYGPTETTVWSSCYQVTDAQAPILIGKPIANTQFFVLDENLNPVPAGVHGELYIGGEGVTKGYLNRDDLTEERYITSPFGFNGERLYRTGDLVKFHETGDLEYFQRVDNQVKVRGFRIELGEIESVLSELDSIQQVVVVVKEPRPGDPRLVAYLVMSEGITMSTTSIRDAIKNDLPDYMLPQYFVELDELPLTPNGKIDRKQLPDAFANSSEDSEMALPDTFASKELAKIWAEVLDVNVENIGLHDNFFEIGGHSLLSMQVIVKVKNITGVKLNARVIILENLEVMAEQCGFTENASTASLKDEKFSDKKSVLKSAFGKLFNR